MSQNRVTLLCDSKARFCVFVKFLSNVLRSNMRCVKETCSLVLDTDNTNRFVHAAFSFYTDYDYVNKLFFSFTDDSDPALK